MSFFALKILDAAGCGRRQGSAMNSLYSALTAVLADPKIRRSGRRGLRRSLPGDGQYYEERRLHKVADTAYAVSGSFTKQFN
jgi:hypothetical protein